MVQTYLHIFASVEPPMQRCLSSGHIRNTSSCIALLPTIESSIWSSQYTSATLQEPANARPLKSGNRIIKCKRYRRARLFLPHPYPPLFFLHRPPTRPNSRYQHTPNLSFTLHTPN